MKNIAQKPKYCFGLTRYSDTAQTGNTSLTRQSEIVKEIAARNGWILREDWSIKQEAVSAFKKKNFPALLALIRDVQAGVIPQNSVCVLEKIDRLTRASLDEGREMIRQMLLAGLEICDSEGNHYTAADLNDIVKLLTLCLRIVAANEYAKNLSDRVKRAHQIRSQRIANGEVITTTGEKVARKDCPVWISCDGKGFELNERAEMVAAIFTDYLNNVGPMSIARKLNAAGAMSLSGRGKWTQSVVYRLLSDRRVMGEKQGVKGYYPAAVTEETFMKVQAKKADNAGKSCVNDSRDNVANLFKGVGFCVCGQRLKHIHGGKSAYCTCYAHVDGKTVCNQPMIKWASFESAVLSILRLNPSVLLVDESGEGMNAQAQILRGRKAEVQKMIDTATENLIHSNSKALAAKVTELEKQAEEIDAQLALESAKTVANKGSIERLTDILESLANISTDQSLRVRVNSWFRENCNRITFDRTKKEFTVDLKNGKLITMNLDGVILGTKSLAAMFSLSPNVGTSGITAPEDVNWTIDVDLAAKFIANNGKI